MMKLSDLESFFSEYNPSDEIIELSQCETIIDQKKFIKSHLNALKGNPGNKTFIPYFNRLVEFYKLVKKQSKAR